MHLASDWIHLAKRAPKLQVLLWLCTFYLLAACSKEEAPPDDGHFSDRYSSCNSMLSNCANGDGNYCLFGYKWGADNDFSPAGYDASGPGSTGGTVSWSLQESPQLASTHRQVDLPARDFDTQMACVYSEISQALAAWSAVADIRFEELPRNSQSDLRFFIADIEQTAVGFPNYADELCASIGGDIVIQTDNGLSNCMIWRLLLLHEIGHALGLGHVDTENIMNPFFIPLGIQSLQAGDTAGIRALYGE